MVIGWTGKLEGKLSGQHQTCQEQRKLEGRAVPRSSQEEGGKRSRRAAGAGSPLPGVGGPGQGARMGGLAPAPRTGAQNIHVSIPEGPEAKTASEDRPPSGAPISGCGEGWPGLACMAVPRGFNERAALPLPGVAGQASLSTVRLSGAGGRG